MTTVHLTSRFRRSFQRLPEVIRRDFKKQLALLMRDPRDRRLQTHPLHGRLSDCHAFCLRDGYRVLFDFMEKDIVLLIDVGSHDAYRKWEMR